MKPLEGVLKYKYNYDYLVAFKDKKDCSTWLGKLFGHVLLYRNITATTSVRIEPTIGGLLIIPYKCNIREILPEIQQKFDTYIWHVKHEDVQKPNILLFGSCVGIVKNLLGIRAWWIITPKQLEKHLKKRG